MASMLLAQALASGKVVVRKGRKVSGQVCITFMDHGLPPVILTGRDPIVLTELPGIDRYAIQRSNIRKLQNLGYIEILV